jgi:high affinity Mn2+ porin
MTGLFFVVLRMSRFSLFSLCLPRHAVTAGVMLWAAFTAGTVRAAEPEQQEDSSAKYQITYNWQKHSAFASPYAGANSLQSYAERMYTFSATAHFGKRVWEGGELYFDPELVQGIPFSGNLVGLGGFTNGEITRAGGPHPKLYRQRLFLRQTWNRGGGTERVDADFNQMAGWVDKNRTVLTVGNFSTLDVFDDNAYAKDPRTQFMNWSNWTYAAYDYAADARGYSWGAAIEWIQGNWALRAGRMSAPVDPNGLPVDLNLLKHYGDQVEVERSHEWLGQPGKLRVLAWRNRAKLATFADARTWLLAHPGGYTTPVALTSVRNSERSKHGFGVNLEQQLREDVGHFLRAMKADGKTETHAFTEVDASISTGLLIKGQRWGRAQDNVGIAYARNMISRDRRSLLAAGGMSFFIGDGALRYKPETIVEAFYNVGVAKGAWFTLDWQRIQNPAYNADRGPVNVYAIRLHAEF